MSIAEKMFLRSNWFSAPRIVRLTRGTGDLGREHDPGALARILPKPGADVLLGAALRFRTWRHRIHLGGIDEIDALRQRIRDLLVRFGFRVLLAPGHGAQPDQADIDT